ncbi:MAG: HEAT repeat domain-containing protein [bacterium]|nr:HEAT repeat domain-containing protein [bacterium]
MSDFRPDIWRLQAQLNTKGLVDALANADIGIRRKAAAALRALGSPSVIPDLKTALEKENDPETRAAILSALEGLQQEFERQQEQSSDAPTPGQQPSEVEQWITQLSSDQHEKIIEAARHLGEMADKLAVPPLIVLFNNPQLPIKVRLAVAEALINLESAPVEVALLVALRSNDWKVRRNGAAILGQLRADWAIEPLSKALRDENENVRKTAFAALKHIGSPDALKAMQSAAKLQPRPSGASGSAPQPQSGLLSRTRGAEPQPEQSLEPAAPPSDETQKFSWPRRKDPNPSLAPTRPLNPNALEEARARFEQLKQERKDDDSDNG